MDENDNVIEDLGITIEEEEEELFNSYSYSPNRHTPTAEVKPPTSNVKVIIEPIKANMGGGESNYPPTCM